VKTWLNCTRKTPKHGITTMYKTNNSETFFGPDPPYSPPYTVGTNRQRRSVGGGLGPPRKARPARPYPVRPTLDWSSVDESPLSSSGPTSRGTREDIAGYSGGGAPSSTRRQSELLRRLSIPPFRWNISSWEPWRSQQSGPAGWPVRVRSPIRARK